MVNQRGRSVRTGPAPTTTVPDSTSVVSAEEATASSGPRIRTSWEGAPRRRALAPGCEDAQLTPDDLEALVAAGDVAGAVDLCLALGGSAGAVRDRAALVSRCADRLKRFDDGVTPAQTQAAKVVVNSVATIPELRRLRGGGTRTVGDRASTSLPRSSLARTSDA
jgi:hypothetical protein